MIALKWRYAISHLETKQPDVNQCIQVVAIVQGPEPDVLWIDYLLGNNNPQPAADEEPWATAVVAWERMREIRGHIQDMSEPERVYMLGLLTGSLENALVLLGILVRTKTGKVLTPKDIEQLADEAERGYDPDTLKRKNCPLCAPGYGHNNPTYAGPPHLHDGPNVNWLARGL